MEAQRQKATGSRSNGQLRTSLAGVLLLSAVSFLPYVLTARIFSRECDVCL